MKTEHIFTEKSDSVKIVYAKSIHYFLSILCMLFVYVNEGYT